MAWACKLTETAQREFDRLDKQAQKIIIHYLETRIAIADDPELFGKPLRGDLRGRWRYRVGDYRLVCRIDRGRFLVLVVTVGHRSTVYD